jgi:hypothetical protein
MFPRGTPARMKMGADREHVREGWAAGADVRYASPEEGASIGKQTTALDEVIAMVFGQQGLIAGASLAGIEYSRIIP